jgi:S1-C subfamily serine protease
MSGQPIGDDAAESPTDPSWPERPVWPDGPVIGRQASSASAATSDHGPATSGQVTGGSGAATGGSGAATGGSGSGFATGGSGSAPGSAGSAPAGPDREAAARPGVAALWADRVWSDQPGSGALLPGDWAKPVGSAQAGGTGPDRARRSLGSRLSDLTRGELRGRRLLLAAGALALACTMLGGVIGGYIALGSSGSQALTNPGYTLGTVPTALAGRPASSVAGIAARVTPSVVMIKVNGGEGTGSGFVINGGYIVTDNHVVTLDNQVSNAALEVYFSDGKSAAGQLVGRDPYSDIAIIRARGVSRLPSLSLGNSTSVDVGDPVIAVGSPLGLAGTVTSGIVSAVDRPVQPGQATGTSPQVFFDAIQTDAPINPGNSGGPLVNAQGQVIGIDAAIDTLGDNPLTGTQGGSIGLGFAIPINQARRVALQLIRTGHATHAVLGAEVNGSWGGNGAELMTGKAGVSPGGPAAAAGLQPGDVITRFGRQPIGSGDALLDAVRSAVPGARVGLSYVQDGQSHDATVRLGSAPS